MVQTIARRKLAPTRDTGDREGKRPFDIPEMMRRVREAVKPYPKAVLFELADRGYATPFHILVACILTIRTLEEVSLPAAIKLFEVADSPGAMAKLTPER